MFRDTRITRIRPDVIAGIPAVTLDIGGALWGDDSGRQLKDAASRQPTFSAVLVTIPAGGSAHADLFYHGVELSSSGCRPT